MRLLLVIVFALVVHSAHSSVFDWFGKDAFDTIMDKYTSVKNSNCRTKSEYELMLPKGSVSMEPRSNQLLDVSTTIFRNRTCLLSMHDFALSRSYFFSLLYKMTNETSEFWKEPGWEYHQFRYAGIVNAFPHCINSTAVYFDYNKTYPNFLVKIPLNTTIELFAPRVYRYDDTRTSWMREPTRTSVQSRDLGCGIRRNYTNEEYTVNPWYDLWLPDKLSKDDSLKGSFSVGIKYSNKPESWVSHTFFGPPFTRLQDNKNVPVKFTRPYFDCGNRNEWMVSAVAPIVDILPRYRKRKDVVEFGESIPTFVAVASVDTDWNMIDINPCPEGEGNPSPNIFAGIARCKPTTMCQPLTGWGFARGSYECVCRPGYRYPAWQSGPFQGALIELATEEEYKTGFNCLKINYMRVVPSVIGRDPKKGFEPSITNRKKRGVDVDTVETASSSNKGDTVQRDGEARRLLSVPEKHSSDSAKTNAIPDIFVRGMRKTLKPRHEVNFDAKLYQLRRDQVYGTYKHKRPSEKKTSESDVYRQSRSKRAIVTDVIDKVAVSRMEQILEHVDKVKQAPDCKKLSKDDLVLPGDVSYGASEQFQYQARTALAMAHFLSGFYQNVDGTRQSWGILRGDIMLNPDLLFAEVLSHVMADHKIRGFGIWFDTEQYVEPLRADKVTRRQLFAPYAFQQEDQYNAVDMANDPGEGSYLNTDWFLKSKMRWMNTGSGTVRHKLKPHTRLDTNGTIETVFFHESVFYRGADYSAGYWTTPYYACNGYVKDWVITYAAPFFKSDPFNPQAVVFMGVVTVDIKLDYLDINQCSQPFWVPNAFKDTAYCDYETTRCEPIEGKRFTRGAYRCYCKQGYEYPFIENAWFFAGSFMESELKKKQAGEFSRYEHMKCRTGGAPNVRVSVVYTIFQIIFILSILNYSGGH